MVASAKQERDHGTRAGFGCMRKMRKGRGRRSAARVVEGAVINFSGVTRPRALTLLVAATLVAPCAVALAAGHDAPPCSAADAGGAWTSYGHDQANTRTQTGETTLDATRAAS